MSGTAGSGTMLPYAKTLARRSRVRSKQFYNGERLRREKNSRPLGSRSTCTSKCDRGYERRREYRLASLDAAARGKLRGTATAGSRGHLEIDARKISTVPRVSVSINRMCGLDALLAHREHRDATARWLSAAVLRIELLPKLVRRVIERPPEIQCQVSKCI